MRMVARQRDKATRTIYAAEVALYSPDMFIFIDETGSDRRNALRSMDTACEVYQLRKLSRFVRGEHLSTITCISMEGILDYQTVKSSVDGDIFYDFVSSKLLPLLMPFDSKNHHSIVVMDNASIHHVDGICELITRLTTTP
jgi:replication-associated recombination protein RarA